jgi:hypothetical protein
MNDQESGFSVSGIAESVGAAPRYQYKPFRSDNKFFVLNRDGHESIKYEIRFRTVGMPV